MKSDQKKWDARYRIKMGSLAPSKVLEKYHSHTKPGRALDIACGNGRNSLFLAQKGFVVDALDVSPVAIKAVNKLHDNICARCLDLDEWSVPADYYDLIVNIRYLNRHLFSTIPYGLKPGGLLIFETFASTDTSHVYCLAENELRHTFPTLTPLYYEEQPIEPPGKFSRTACLVAANKTHVPEQT